MSGKPKAAIATQDAQIAARLHAGDSIRAIAAATGYHRETIRRVLRAMSSGSAAAGVSSRSFAVGTPVLFESRLWRVQSVYRDHSLYLRGIGHVGVRDHVAPALVQPT